MSSTDALALVALSLGMSEITDADHLKDYGLERAFAEAVGPNGNTEGRSLGVFGDVAFVEDGKGDVAELSVDDLPAISAWLTGKNKDSELVHELKVLAAVAAAAGFDSASDWLTQVTIPEILEDQA